MPGVNIPVSITVPLDTTTATPPAGTLAVHNPTIREKLDSRDGSNGTTFTPDNITIVFAAILCPAMYVADIADTLHSLIDKCIKFSIPAIKFWSKDIYIRCVP